MQAKKPNAQGQDMKRDRFPNEGGGLYVSHTFADPATALIPKWIHLYNQNVECDFRATLLTLCRVIQNRYTRSKGTDQRRRYVHVMRTENGFNFKMIQ